MFTLYAMVDLGEWSKELNLKKVLAVVLGLFLIGERTVIAADVLRLLTEEKVPLNYLDAETRTIKGIGHDIVVEMMQLAEVQHSVSLMPWKRAYRETLMNPGTCLYSMNRTPAREELFEWVGPLFESRWAFFRRPGSSLLVKSLDDLQGLVVVGKESDASVVSLRQARPDLRIVTTQTEPMAVKLLFRQRADIWLTGVIVARSSAEEAKMPTPELAFFWHPTSVWMGCAKGTDQGLLDTLHKVSKDLGPVQKAVLSRYDF